MNCISSCPSTYRNRFRSRTKIGHVLMQTFDISSKICNQINQRIVPDIRMYVCTYVCISGYLFRITFPSAHSDFDCRYQEDQRILFDVCDWYPTARINLECTSKCLQTNGLVTYRQFEIFHQRYEWIRVINETFINSNGVRKANAQHNGNDDEINESL